jgi:hypothetical protein
MEGGKISTPEADIAHMRYLRETQKMTVPQISAWFGDCYTNRYITAIINYESRRLIEPKARPDYVPQSR